MNSARDSRRWPFHLVAVLAFSIAAIWCARSVVEHPATVVNYEPGAFLGALAASDLRRTVTQLAYATRQLATDPLHFFDGPMCYPSPASVTFGEHMLGEAIQGVPAYLLWDDPIVIFNFVAAFKPWLAALSMYALAFYWTGSTVAAFIAGIFFGFHPTRMHDLIHPSVKGNEFIPLILLAMDRLFTWQRWRDALLLACASSLQLLASMYVLIQFAIIVAIYGGYLLLRNYRAFPALVPKLIVVCIALAATGYWVFSPYLATRATWGILEGRDAGWTGVFDPGDYVLLFLAGAGLVDRLFRARPNRRNDPRFPLLFAGFTLYWFMRPWPIPLTGQIAPPLSDLARSWMPGLDAIRAPDNILFGIAVPLALLAAFGTRALGAIFSGSTRAVILGLVATAAITEAFLPAWAPWSSRPGLPSSAFRLRPSEADLAAVRAVPPGPVFDYPGNYHILWVGHLSRYVLLGAYHQNRTASCKASFLTPVQSNVITIAHKLPRPDAARELWALGFRSIIFHVQDEEPFRGEADQIIAALTEPSEGPRLIPISEGKTVRAFQLVADGPITTDIGSLSPALQGVPPQLLEDEELWFWVRAGETTFRHPDPIQPTELLITWKQGSVDVQSEIVRANLPLALAAEQVTAFSVHANIPNTPGRMYEVTLALPEVADHILARKRYFLKGKQRTPPTRSRP